MKEGFFYIANSEAKKIMKTNSYGNLLNLYYNPSVNPEPSFKKNGQIAGATIHTTEYEFNEITSIAVDERQYLYVVDKLPAERQEIDQDTNQVMSQIVLRFDQEGKFVDYLGQEGPGGTPFPFIQKIYTQKNNELVIVCKTLNESIVYWFTPEGTCQFTVPFDQSNIPNPYKDDSNLENWMNIDDIIPDPSRYILYIKADYSVCYVDEASKVQSGIDYKESLLYPFDVEENVYEKPITIPPYTEQVASGLSSVSYSIPYDFLGVTDSGWFFFIIANETGYSIQMVQPNGQAILNRNLSVDYAENLYYTFALSSEGILSVLMAQKEKAVVDWWRTDLLIDAIGH